MLKSWKCLRMLAPWSDRALPIVRRSQMMDGCNLTRSCCGRRTSSGWLRQPLSAARVRR